MFFHGCVFKTVISDCCAAAFLDRIQIISDPDEERLTDGLCFEPKE
jgi:hypothetical protein